MVGIVIMVAALIPVLLAWRLMPRKQAPVPAPVVEAPRPRSHPAPQPTPRPRYVRQPMAPPVTLETIPPAGLVPAIDRGVFAALAASGSQATATVRPPQQFARGSQAGYMPVANDLDDAETLGGGDDLDEDMVTRSNMEPVR